MSHAKYILPVFAGSALLLNIAWLNHRALSKHNLHSLCPIAKNPLYVPPNIIDVLLQAPIQPLAITMTDEEIIKRAMSPKKLD